MQLPTAPVPGGIRPSAVVVLAFALLIGGVLLAVESMSVEDQMRTSYEEALALSHLALETQQTSTQLRNDQVRAARSLAQMTLLATALAMRRRLQAAVSTARRQARRDRRLSPVSGRRKPAGRAEKHIKEHRRHQHPVCRRTSARRSKRQHGTRAGGSVGATVRSIHEFIVSAGGRRASAHGGSSAPGRRPELGRTLCADCFFRSHAGLGRSVDSVDATHA